MPTGRRLPKDWKGNEGKGTPRNASTGFWYKSKYENKEMQTGEIEKLEKLCRNGDSKACAKLEKLKKDNEDFLEHLMAIADYDEYPPKLKEPSNKE